MYVCFSDKEEEAEEDEDSDDVQIIDDPNKSQEDTGAKEEPKKDKEIKSPNKDSDRVMISVEYI